MSHAGCKIVYAKPSVVDNKDTTRNGPLRAIAFFGFLISILLGPAVTLSIFGKTPSLSYSDIYIFFMSYLFVLGLMARVFKFKIDKQVLVLSTLYILAQIISLVVNQSDQAKAMVSIMIFGSGVIAYFIITSVSENIRETDWMLYMILLFGSTISILLLIDFVFLHSPYVEFDKSMIRVALGGSNYLATFLVLVAPIGFGLFISAKQIPPRIFSGVCTLSIVLGLIITSSKGAFLSLAIGIFVFVPILLGKGPRLRYLFIVALFAVLLFTLVTTLLPNPIIKANIKSVKERIKRLDYLRIELLRNSWNVFISHPLFGTGPFSTSTTIVGNVYGRAHGAAHNFLLQTLADFGLVGAIPFFLIILIFLIRAYKNCFKERDRQRRIQNVFILTAILVSLMHGLVEVTFQGAEYTTIFWVIMALVSIRYRSNDSDANVKDSPNTSQHLKQQPGYQHL